MSLFFTPNSVVVYPRVETPDEETKEVSVPTEEAGVSLDCYIYPERAEVLVDERTEDVLKNPHRAMLNLSDIGKLPYGARVVEASTVRQFRVTKQATRADAGGPFAIVDHALGDLELLEKPQR